MKLLIILFFISPYILLSTKIGWSLPSDLQEFFWALKNTFVQATISAVITLILAIVSAWGWISGVTTKYQFLEKLMIVPCFLPTLFVLLAIFEVINPFPIGLIGIVIVHVFINYGLVTLNYKNYLTRNLGDFLTWAYVYKAPRWIFFKKIILPQSYAFLFSTFIFVFSVCFTSFSVPLVVGGSFGTTLEVLIFEKIRIDANWSTAMSFSALQSIILIMFYFFQGQKTISKNNKLELKITRYFQSDWIRFFSFLPLMLFICGYFIGFKNSFNHIDFFRNEIAFIFFQSIRSLFLGLFVASGFLIFFIGIGYFFRSKSLIHFLTFYMPPTTALCSFLFLVFLPIGYFITFLISMMLTFFILNIGFFYRLEIKNKIQELDSLVFYAKFLGASNLKIYLEIVLPLLWPSFCKLSGIAGAWAVGDFAVGRILAYKDLTLALSIETLMSSYRFSQAIFLSFILLCLCFFVYQVFDRGVHVIGEKVIRRISRFCY